MSGGGQRMTTSTHRHPKWGEGEIVGWFEEDMVMFRSNHGKTMLREATLTPLEQSPLGCINPSPPTSNPPELQPPQTFTPAPAAAEVALKRTSLYPSYTATCGSQY